jgi:hypothetical protein
MKMIRMVPALSRAAGRSEATVREVARQLRIHGKIPGAGLAGYLAPEATLDDIAKVLLTLLSGEKPTAAPLDLERSSGLVIAIENREASLLWTIQAALAELVEHGDVSGGVANMSIEVARPWPYALVRFAYEDGQTAVAEYHHTAAKTTGSAAKDAANVEALVREWGYRPGATQWSEVGLSGLRIIADAYAGRWVAAEVLEVAPPQVEPRPWETSPTASPALLPPFLAREQSRVMGLR